jgi:hypothetical protein
MRFSAWAWVGGLPTYATRHPTRAARTARLMPAAAPIPRLSFVDDCLVLAALNKCLAKSNKSRPPSNATKRRNAMNEYRQGSAPVGRP